MEFALERDPQRLLKGGTNPWQAGRAQGYLENRAVGMAGKDRVIRNVWGDAGGLMRNPEWRLRNYDPGPQIFNRAGMSTLRSNAKANLAKTAPYAVGTTGIGIGQDIPTDLKDGGAPAPEPPPPNLSGSLWDLNYSGMYG